MEQVDKQAEVVEGVLDVLTKQHHIGQVADGGRSSICTSASCVISRIDTPSESVGLLDEHELRIIGLRLLTISVRVMGMTCPTDGPLKISVDPGNP